MWGELVQSFSRRWVSCLWRRSGMRCRTSSTERGIILSDGRVARAGQVQEGSSLRIEDGGEEGGSESRSGTQLTGL